jgi:uncharacterized membrane protein YhaH (DUF805 family)
MRGTPRDDRWFRRSVDYLLIARARCAESRQETGGQCMSFAEAVKSGFDNYTNFDGRAHKPAFWWWFLFGILAGIVANIIDAIIGTLIFSIIVSLGLLLPNISVGIRRLHDTNRTGWWILIGLIPLIGWIVLLIFYLQQSDPGPNDYGPPMDEGVAPPAAIS